MPKDSTKGQLLAAAGANEAPYEEIPIREEERLALEGDAEAIRQRSPLDIEAERSRVVPIEGAHSVQRDAWDQPGRATATQVPKPLLEPRRKLL